MRESGFSKLSFAKTFVLPSLLIFTVPICALLFFKHAQNSYDAEARESLLGQIEADTSLSAEERANAVRFFTEVPYSTLLRDPEFAAEVDSSVWWDFAMFRWGIDLSFWSIVSGIGVFLLAGLCVVLSLRSQQAQYLSLLAGWHVLRIYGALQAVIQGLLLVALSYWVTAFWFQKYVPKLIGLMALLVVVAVGAVIKAIFTRPRIDHAVTGKVIENQAAMPLWKELSAVCEKVGSTRPDQIIVGIDDMFFVTEMPIAVNDEVYEGRTLYVSLSMLKEMSGAEADAVLAHEMAHFSGNDTLYSRKITPLLVRFSTYLEALDTGVVTKPIFYFINCFRSLFELSLKQRSREREFRADRIAAGVTSPSDFAAGLMRVVSYSKFRNQVQDRLFGQETVLESANISQLIDEGFRGYSTNFMSSGDIGDLAMSHPFDSHPAVRDRFQAIGVTLEDPQISRRIAEAGDGEWYRRIDGAVELEREMWSDFECLFREAHEASLAYRFLPGNVEEEAVVVKAFPEIAFEGTQGTLTINHATVHYPPWKNSLEFAEITGCSIDEYGTLTISHNRSPKGQVLLKTQEFKKQKAEVRGAFEAYYARYLNAAAYQAQKVASATEQSG